MTRKIVDTNNAPAAVGPYSQAVWHDDLLFLSGQTPLEPATGRLVEGDISAQAEQVFKNIHAVLEAAGLNFDNAIKLTVFLTDMNNYVAVNEVYAKQFEAPFPARSAVAVAALPVNAQVEIELVAHR